MHHIGFMGAFHRVAYLEDVFEGLVYLYPASVGEYLRERGALYVFHGQIGKPLVLTEAVNLDDVAVAKPGHRLGFLVEPLLEAGAVGIPGIGHLERDLALEFGIESSIHRSHGATAKKLNHVKVGYSFVYKIYYLLLLHFTCLNGLKWVHFALHWGPIMQASYQNEPTLMAEL
jgi:hypothetical protein